MAPAFLLLVAIAVLFPLLVSPGPGDQAGGLTTASTAPAVTRAPTSEGSALLVIEQDGAAVALALVFAGSKGGVVLGVPGLTLLRSGDLFAQLVGLYAPDKQQVLAQPLADALAVPVGAVASAKWSDLRDALAGEGIEALPPEQLDAEDGNAIQVAESLAAALSKPGVNPGEPFWKALPMAGDGDGFRAAVGAALLAERSTAWVGRAVAGTLVKYGHLTYLEPDITTARDALAGTGAGG